MHEQEQYECFGIPSHVWITSDAGNAPAAAAAKRRRLVHDGSLLGCEALPSPPLPDSALAG
jgi:hypothetical protein